MIRLGSTQQYSQASSLLNSSDSVREWVSDKGKQWSDSGPIKTQTSEISLYKIKKLRETPGWASEKKQSRIKKIFVFLQASQHLRRAASSSSCGLLVAATTTTFSSFPVSMPSNCTNWLHWSLLPIFAIGSKVFPVDSFHSKDWHPTRIHEYDLTKEMIHYIVTYHCFPPEAATWSTSARAAWLASGWARGRSWSRHSLLLPGNVHASFQFQLLFTL